MFRHLFAALTFAAALTVATAASASPLDFHVFVNTTPLLGNPGPFSLDFQLIDGGNAAAPNTAVISNFSFGGGSPAGAPFLDGGASGSLATSVTLTDTAFFNDFFQDFIPGTSVQFDVHLTENFAGGLPDALSFFIFGSDGFPVDSAGPGDALFLVNINSAPLLLGSVQIFQSPSLGPIGASQVSEPASLLLVGGGILLGIRRFGGSLVRR